MDTISAMPDTKVVVTGGSSVSEALQSFFLGRGARVAVLAPDGTAVREGAELVPCRFGSESEVESAVSSANDALDGVTIAVHTWMAPGLIDAKQFEDIDEQTWLQSCEATLAGAWWLSRQILGPLRSDPGGLLVYVVPNVGLTGAARFAMLAAVSEGIRVLAKGVGRQSGKQGMTVHTITAAPEHWIPSAVDGSLHRAISLSTPAMGGSGQLDADIAPLVAMLSSRDGHFWTAGTLVADGGVWMAL